MHEHATGWAYAFIAANTLIAAGYVSVPFLVLPYLPLTRLVTVFGAGLFGGCALTHLYMITVHPHASPVWVWLHLLQAICTWGFVLAFRHMLRRAQQRRTGGGGAR